MLSETLATGLEHYKIGPKIRALRLEEEARPGSARRAHRPVTRHVVQNRTRRAIPHAADTASNFARVRGGT